MKQSVILLTCRLYLINLIAIAIFFWFNYIEYYIGIFLRAKYLHINIRIYTFISKISKVESILKTEIYKTDLIKFDEYYELVKININASKYDFILKIYLKYLLKYN